MRNRLHSIIEEDDEEATEYNRSKSRERSIGSRNSLVKGSIQVKQGYAPEAPKFRNLKNVISAGEETAGILSEDFKEQKRESIVNDTPVKPKPGQITINKKSPVKGVREEMKEVKTNFAEVIEQDRDEFYSSAVSDSHEAKK